MSTTSARYTSQPSWPLSPHSRVTESRQYRDSHSHSHSQSSSESSSHSPPRNMNRHLMGSIKNKFSKSPTDAKSSSGLQAPRRPLDQPNVPAPATRRPDRPGMNAFTTPSNEPPPAYTPDPPAVVPARVAAPAQVSAPVEAVNASSDTADDPYSFLSTFDTIFLVDDSGSMAGRSWRECSAALQAITPICTAHDSDGIDIVFLNTPTATFHNNITDASTVHEIFSTIQPRGGTPTGQRLNNILKPYLQRLERDLEGTKPLNVIVITDGVPSDDVESVLIAAARKLDRLDAVPWQIGVQFMQVGEEEGAREHLEGLDDELSRMGGGCRDIVDTVPMSRGAALTGEGILKTVLGAVNKRLDRRANRS